MINKIKCFFGWHDLVCSTITIKKAGRLAYYASIDLDNRYIPEEK